MPPLHQKPADLDKKICPKPHELREALWLTRDAIRDFVEDQGADAPRERIRSDGDFVTDFKLEAPREMLMPDDPSYILALAMGAGKTVLIGVIFATDTVPADQTCEVRRFIQES